MTHSYVYRSQRNDEFPLRRRNDVTREGERREGGEELEGRGMEEVGGQGREGEEGEAKKG